MTISKNTFLNETTKALNKQVEYNDQRYVKKDDTQSLDITVGSVKPETGLWFNTYTTLFPTSNDSEEELPTKPSNGETGSWDYNGGGYQPENEEETIPINTGP